MQLFIIDNFHKLIFLLDYWVVTHMASDILVNIGSDNGLLPVLHQAISCSNTGISSAGLIGSNSSKIWIKSHQFSFQGK